LNCVPLPGARRSASTSIGIAAAKLCFSISAVLLPDDKLAPRHAARLADGRLVAISDDSQSMSAPRTQCALVSRQDDGSPDLALGPSGSVIKQVTPASLAVRRVLRQRKVFVGVRRGLAGQSRVALLRFTL